MKPFARWFAKGTQAPPAPPPTAGPAAREPAAGPAPAAAVVAEPEIDLDAIDDPARLAELVVEGRTSDLRRRAAERVADPVQLRALIRKVRGSDKAVYKILKGKCDALNADDRRREQFSADVRALCESLERHSKRTPDAVYAATLEHLIGRWQALAPTPGPADQERSRAAVDRCREVLAEQARKTAERDVREAAAREALAERERERQAAREASASAAAAEATARQAAQAAEAAEAAKRLEQEAALERLVRQLGGLIRKANESLRDGNTQQAAGLRRAIAAKWPEGFAAPAHLSRQLQQLDETLADLKGWKDYAVAPKRLELIAAMEALIGSEEDPTALARRIQTLQAQWRTISKGIVSEAPAEWERFHQASQTAYQPCREYFERQLEQRRTNLENRRALVARLTAFEAGLQGEQTDWRLVMQVLREAPLEWRRFFPVEREGNRPLQAEFDAARARLQATLDAWHARNEADKESLIKRARHLAGQEDTRDAIEAVKRLQILWKETGQASRARDQALWGEFREVCDAIYRRREQAHADYSAGLEASKQAAERLCAEIETQAAVVAQDATALPAKIADWRTAFEALDEMPRSEARGIRDRFERAILRLESEIALARERDALRARERLFEALRLVRSYEWSVFRGAGTQEASKVAAEDFIAGVGHWPKGALALVRGALQRAATAAPVDPNEAEKALRVLCIRAEIRADLATPAEDAALRREYQVQRLMTGMGQGVRAPRAAGTQGDDSAAVEWDALVLDWIPVGGVDPAVYEALQARFVASLGPRPVVRPPRATFRPLREDPEARERAPRGGQGRGFGR